MVPAVVEVKKQTPAAKLQVFDAAPSLTITLPVGVPPPEVTVYATEYDWPVPDGSGLMVPTVTVVTALFTVWDLESKPAANLLSPA